MKNRLLAASLALVVVLTLVAGACAPAAAPALKATETKAPAETAKPKEAPAKSETDAPKPKAEAPAPTATTVSKPQPLSPPVTVKAGVVAAASAGGIFIAQERGYFKELGINLETVPIDTGPRLIPALASGELDVGFGGVGAGLFNALARGVDIKIVAGASVRQPGIKDAVIAVRKDLIDEGKVKDFADLKGRNVAVGALDGAAGVELAQALAKGNLKISDVNVITMGYPDMLVAFANKSIDAGLQIEPNVTAGIERNLALPLRGLGIGDIFPNHHGAVYLYSSQFIKNKTEAARRFMVALIRGHRDYDGAFFKNKDREAIVSIISTATKTELAILNKISASKLTVDGYAIAGVITIDQDWLAEQGYIKEKVDIGKVIDNQFVDYAIGVLGKYQ